MVNSYGRIFYRYSKQRAEKLVKIRPLNCKKIYDLISDIQMYGMLGGRGKPEQLKHYKSPVRYSRQINKGDRFVYCQQNENDLLIISCKGHYDDK